MNSEQKSRKNATAACVSCRQRKIKCNIGKSVPCERCTRNGIECVLIMLDRRKQRYRAQYTASLEAKVAHYEAKLSRYESAMKTVMHGMKKSSDLMSGLIEAQNFGPPEVVQTPSTFLDTSKQETALPTNVKGRLKATNFENDEKYSVSVYGPTSVFNTETVPSRAGERELRPALLSTDPTVGECIKLFFRWQYPDMHLFIFREAFLLDFFNPKSSGVYASNELIYAICAIGSLVSEDPQLRSLAPGFYRRSHELLVQNLDSPSISSFQAFLLLGLFDVYNGRNNSGWMLTGDGLRMGYGIGFHLSPENWLVGKDEEVSKITTAVRSRIFWGSFMVDRFLGLILGRPSILKMDESTIPESINMPAIETIGEYTYPGTVDYDRANYIDVSNPLKSIIKLVGISDSMMVDLFSHGAESREKRDLLYKLELLEIYNERILDWRQSLASILQWDRLTLAIHGHDHTKMFMRYFYYIVLLCLNRPFIEVSKGIPLKDSTNALQICESAIDDIHLAILSFVKHHGFRRCSILIVYSCIICISIILLTTSGGNLNENSKFEEYFFDFMTLLKLSSLTWKLSEKSYLKVKGTFQTEYKLSYESELSNFLQRKQNLNDEFLMHGNSIISVSGEPHEKVSPEFLENALDNEFANFMEFGGFGGPPVFMNADQADWGNFFPGYGHDGEPIDPS